MNFLANNASLAQAAGGAVIAIVFILIFIALIVVVIAGMWKMFEKAGQPGWAALIPIYNTYIMCKIGGRPGWWLLLMLIPYVGVIFQIIVIVDISKSFGKTLGFHLGMVFLTFIFIPILGFGSAQYLGPSAAK